MYDVFVVLRGKNGAIWLPVSANKKRRRRASNNKQPAQKRKQQNWWIMLWIGWLVCMFLYANEYFCCLLCWHFILFQCGRFLFPICLFMFAIFLLLLLCVYSWCLNNKYKSARPCVWSGVRFVYLIHHYHSNSSRSSSYLPLFWIKTWI